MLDRRELARRAFSTPEGTAALSAITHPEITRLAIEEIHAAESDGTKAAVIDAALLYDSPLVAVCQKNICVVADEEIRLQRIMKRDSITESDAKLRINAQPSAEYYTEKSDIIINNNNADTETQIAELMNGIYNN
jgi:dephospho-CoA kinase